MGVLRDCSTLIKARVTVDSVTDLLDTFTAGATYPAIFVQGTVPSAYQDLTLLQIYRVSTIGSSEINNPLYTVNCRADSEYKADLIAQAVYDVLNREIDDTSYMTCTVSQNINEDNLHFNTPVDCRVYRRTQ